MVTIVENLQTVVRRNRPIYFDFSQFVRENITRSWLLTLWLIILAYITISYTTGQLGERPWTTAVLLLIWLVTVGLTVLNEVTRNHIPITLWLRENLYSSITNALITLFLALVIVAGLLSFFDYAVARASFTQEAEQVEANFEALEERGIEPGANWGAVADNMRNLMVYRLPREDTWRVWATLLVLIGLGIPSVFIYRGERYRRHPVRNFLTNLWLMSPLVIFALIRGWSGGNILILTAVVALFALTGLFRLRLDRVYEQIPALATIGIRLTIILLPLIVFASLWVASDPDLNPESAWGGLLFTMILSVFAIVVSFPMGLLLALGRRSTVRGIPAWLIYLVAAGFTIWLLSTRTPAALAAATSTFGQLLAYWPLLIPVVAYLFQRYFRGNVVAVFSTIYIEVVRGVPFITVLFMSIILFPIFLPPGMEILGTWRVMVAAAIFASAYLAENVRGGLQSIPNGQYEAADAIGLNTFQKYRLIILPQALRAVIPAIVGQFIGLFKDTTLVAIVGLTDLLGAANLISAQPDWLGIRVEPYIFIAVIYYVGSAVMAGYSRRLEVQLGVGER